MSSYGQPPPYGQPYPQQSPYGAQPPYGQPAPPYGQPAPYGGPPNPYGRSGPPNPGYGQPSYGQEPWTPPPGGAPRRVERPIPVVTMESVPGRTTLAVIGDVLGVVARQRELPQQLRSGSVGDSYSAMLTQSRQDAVAKVVEMAVGAGADAVVGLRFDSSEITQTMSEVVAYGTAVRLGPARQEAATADSAVAESGGAGSGVPGPGGAESGVPGPGGAESGGAGSGGARSAISQSGGRQAEAQQADFPGAPAPGAPVPAGSSVADPAAAATDLGPAEADGGDRRPPSWPPPR